jgi:hypothetical protein
MVGIATAQNTVNTVPMIQLKIPRLQFVETDGAKKNGWVTAASRALMYKNIKVEDSISLNTKIESDPFEISSFLILQLAEEEAILWNIGGGQKNHTLGLWEAFKLRRNRRDQVCYSNTQSRVIELWYWEENLIKHHRIPLDYDDDLASYLAVYGFEIKEGGEGTLLYQNGEVQNRQEAFDWFQFQEFRYFLTHCFPKAKADDMYSLASIRKLLSDKDLAENLYDSLVKVNPILNTDKKIMIGPNFIKVNSIGYFLSYLKNKILIPESLESQEFTFTDRLLIERLANLGFPPKLKMNSQTVSEILGMASGFYFENILICQIQKILERGDHLVKKVYSNVKIKSSDNEAEFDLLLLTSLGTLHVLDGKLDAFDKKDENSRKHVLAQAGGAFSSFQPVFSFYPEDVEAGSLSPALVQKLKDYSVSKSNFMVYNHGKEDITQIVINETKVNLKHFNKLLVHLNLLKN